MMMNNLLFVYGSLLSADNEFAAYLNNNASLCSTGKVKGKLYDIGEYPGALIDPEDTNSIPGSIFLLNHPEEALIVLDDYEGYGPEQLQPNLFIRKLLLVETINGTINCWVYVYNLPVNGLRQIISGDYLEYLAQKPPN